MFQIKKKFITIFLVSLLVYIVFIFINQVNVKIIKAKETENFSNENSSTTSNSNINNLLAQSGKVRTCLAPKQVGKREKSTTHQHRYTTQIKLKGTCLGINGCVILRCNSQNTNLPDTLNQLERCENLAKLNEKQRQKCQDPSWIKNRQSMIKRDSLQNPPAGCQEINFSVVSSNLIVQKNNNVLGVSTTIPRGPVDVVIEQDDTANHVDYNYYAVGDYGQIEQMGKGAEITPIDANDNTQKLATLNFSFQDINIDDLSKDCVSISWDPYGRVFDAVSLEPMKDIEVTLFDPKTKKKALSDVIQYLDFSDETKIDGVYNIQVDNEIERQFTISVEPPKSHKFTRSPTLNKNYSSIYSDIYYPGDIITEKAGLITHHDIPLQPISAPYYMPKEDVQAIKETLKQFDNGSSFVFTGRVTFPKAEVCIANQCTYADKYGFFNLSISENDIKPEFMEIKVKKVNLTAKKETNLSLFTKLIKFFYKEVQAQQSIKIEDDKTTFEETTNIQSKKIGFEPILRHIEGFAYDKNGQIIPKAKVEIRLKMNDSLYYTTTADDSGFFTIYGSNLPFFEYYITYKSPTGETFNQTTSDFYKANKDYLEREKINLIKATKINQPIIDSQTGKLNHIVNQPVNYPKNNKVNFKNINLMIIIVIIILLITITVGLVIYIKKYKSP